MSAAEDLANALNDQFGGGQMIFGTVTGIDALAERSLVEVQLASGSYVNAFAWTQADIQVGNDVVLGKIPEVDDTIYCVLSVNAPPLLSDTETAPDHNVWASGTFRSPRIPRVLGGVEVLGNTQYVMPLGFDTYTTMRIDLEFSVAPVGNKVKYWLYGYDPTDVNLDLAPPWKMEIGTHWKSNDKTYWRTLFDLTAPGFDSEWIYDYDSAFFVVALERTSALVTRGSAAGRIRTVSIHFDDFISMDPVNFTAEGLMTVGNPAPQNIIGIDFEGGGEMFVLRWYEDNPLIVSIESTVRGSF